MAIVLLRSADGPCLSISISFGPLFFPLTQGGKNEHQETEEKFAPVTGELVTLLADPGGPVRPVSSQTAGDLSWGQVKDMCSLQVDAIRQLDHFYFFAFISFWRCNMRMLNQPANHAHHIDRSTIRANGNETCNDRAANEINVSRSRTLRPATDGQ